MVTASRLTALALLTLTLALAYFATATTAGARPIPAPDGGGDAPHSPLSPRVVMNHPGSPVWTYLVVALAAAGLSLALAWAVSRLPHSHTSVVHA